MVETGIGRHENFIRRQAISAAVGAILPLILVASAFVAVNQSVVERAAQPGTENAPPLEVARSSARDSYSGGATAPAYFRRPISIAASPSNASQATPGGTHWWYADVVQPSFSETTPVIYYNITTPDSFSESTAVFIGASAWESLGNYAQEGIVSGGSQWVVTMNSPAACGTTNQWCAYFVMCIYSQTSDCTATPIWPYTGWITWQFGPLKSSTSYEEQMQITWAHTRFGLQTFFSGELYDSAHNLLNGFAAPYASNSGVTFSVSNQQCNFGYACGYGFTDYEEVLATNPVEPWPAFNLHTSIAVHSITAQIPWSGFSGGSGYPTSNYIEIVTSFSGGQNYLQIDNEPFAVWVGTWFGNGLYQWVSGVCGGCPFSVSVPIDPLADPTGGYSVSYSYQYCTVPCADVSFSPASSIVQPDSQFYNPNAHMIVTGTAPTSPTTYVMSLYSYYQADNSYYVSQWQLTFLY